MSLQKAQMSLWQARSSLWARVFEFEIWLVPPLNQFDAIPTKRGGSDEIYFLINIQVWFVDYQPQ